MSRRNGNGNENGEESWQAMRCGMVREFVALEAEDLTAAVDRAGWQDGLVHRATCLANSLLQVFGPGEYRIIIYDVYRDPEVRQHVDWLPSPFRR